MNIKEWLGDNQLGIDIWEKKYRRNNETLDEWFDRISAGDEKLKKLIIEKKFLFGGRILSNRGLEEDEKVTYSNCYVITPPRDNIESIYKAASKLARTYSYGGGCGIDISNLAPAGARVRNQAKETSGAVSFMSTFNEVTKTIGQNGRRGALMISIDCNHPDLPEFIDIKAKSGSIEQANISVKVSDDFMKAVINDEQWEMKFIRDETGEEIIRHESARELFDKLAENNWNWAEPGILYWDRVSNYNLLQYEDGFKYAGVNPCAEEPLPAGGSCLLGSINLSQYIRNEYTTKSFFDYDAFCGDVFTCIIALNDVLEEGLEKHPLKEQKQTVNDWRQIGLGIMGLADALIKLEIPYGSEEAEETINKIGQNMAVSAIMASSGIAAVKGAYKRYSNKVLKSDFFKKHITDSDSIRYIEKHGLKNSQLLTCAPTGSIATMLGVSNGIEPLFAKSWKRKTESLHGEDVYYEQYPNIVEEAIKKIGLPLEELDDLIVTAHDLKPIQRIKMQAALQNHIDASISSTVNLPYEATIEDVKQVYLEAWEQGLKGVTIYRDGCAKGGILTKEEVVKENKPVKIVIEEGNSPMRGVIIKPNEKDCIGFKRKLMTGCGSLHCAVYFDINTGDLTEIYLSKGSTGGCHNFMVGLSRMISASARAGISVADIVDQLMSTGACSSYVARTKVKGDTSQGSCCPMAVGYAIKEMWEEFNGIGMKKPIVQVKTPIHKEPVKIKCPDCGGELHFEGGCNICRSCGYTKCD